MDLRKNMDSTGGIKPMNDDRKEILIIDDSVENIKVLIELLKPEYNVSFAVKGKKGIELAKTKKIDLILLDILMDDIDGYEVCRRLKLDKDTLDIPVIFVTAVSESMDEAKGFAVGGVDYITKPFVPVVVLARVKNQVKLAEAVQELQRMYSLALDANPITQLPGNNTIREHISLLIEKKEKCCVMYADLDNFKAYNDKYGFANGDKVISATVAAMKEVAASMGLSSDIFLGHIGGDDFVIVLKSAEAEKYVQLLLEKFDWVIRSYYNEEDQKKGRISTKNRNGVLVEFPIISLSIAGVDLEKKTYGNYFEVIDNCTILKSRAKKIPGSVYIIE